MQGVAGQFFSRFSSVFLVHVVICFFVFGCECQCNRLLAKTHPRNDLLCVEWDVKPYTLTHVVTSITAVIDNHYNVIRYTVPYIRRLKAPCGLRGCKNRAHPVYWPVVVKGVPNQGVDCFVI